MIDYKKNIIRGGFWTGFWSSFFASIFLYALWACVQEPMKAHVLTYAPYIVLGSFIIGGLGFMADRLIRIILTIKRIKKDSFPFLTTKQSIGEKNTNFITFLESIDETINILRLDLGVIDYYETRNQAIEKNEASIKNSLKIDALNFKCKVLINSAYQLAADSRRKIRCLVLNPYGYGVDKYIQKRIDAIESQTKPDIAYHKRRIIQQINELKYINGTIHKLDNIACRYFCEELKWSLIITDNYLLLTFYGDETSDKAPCFKIGNKTRWGKALSKHFEDLWELNEANDAFT